MPRMGKDTFIRIRTPGGAGGYIMAPVLTTTQRNALTGEEGMIIFNSTTDQLEEYDGATWEAVGQIPVDTHAALGDAHALGGNVFVGLENYQSVGQGTWVIAVGTSFVYNIQIYNDTGADADNISYKVYLPKGTYTLCMYGKTNVNHGIMDVDIDDVEVASFDWYSSGAVNVVRKTQTAIAVAASGLKTVKIRVHGKNDSSSSYVLIFNTISFWRTA